MSALSIKPEPSDGFGIITDESEPMSEERQKSGTSMPVRAEGLHGRLPAHAETMSLWGISTGWPSLGGCLRARRLMRAARCGYFPAENVFSSFPRPFSERLKVSERKVTLNTSLITIPVTMGAAKTPGSPVEKTVKRRHDRHSLHKLANFRYDHGLHMADAVEKGLVDVFKAGQQKISGQYDKRCLHPSVAKKPQRYSL